MASGAGVQTKQAHNAASCLDVRFVEEIRGRVRQHLEGGGKIRDLEIDPDKPAENLLFALVGRTPPAPTRAAWYRCSYCERDRQFKAGTLVYCEDEKLRLIGDDCWKDHFEHEVFVEARRDLQLYHKRQSFNAVRASLHEAVASCAKRLFSIIWSDRLTPLREAETFGPRLNKEIPVLWQALSLARRDQGNLIVERALTEAERNFQSETGGRQSRFKRLLIHRAQGLGMLEPHFVSEPLNAGMRNLQIAVKTINEADWDNLTLRSFGKKLSEIIAMIRQGLDAIDRADALVREVRAFCAETNLQGFKDWGRDHDCDLWLHGELNVFATHIVFLFDRGQNASITLPNAKMLPAFPATDTLRGLLQRAES